jgi:hypothetical protein
LGVLSFLTLLMPGWSFVILSGTKWREESRVMNVVKDASLRQHDRLEFCRF